jgi:hypothetical protein
MCMNLATNKVYFIESSNYVNVVANAIFTSWNKKKIFILLQHKQPKYNFHYYLHMISFFFLFLVFRLKGHSYKKVSEIIALNYSLGLT